MAPLLVWQQALQKWPILPVKTAQIVDERRSDLWRRKRKEGLQLPLSSAHDSSLLSELTCWTTELRGGGQTCTARTDC